MEQVTKLVTPHPDALNLVHSWLEDHGVPSSVSMTLGGDWLMVVGVPLPQPNVILGATYQLYHHVEVNDTAPRAQLLAPCTARAHSNRRADNVLRLSAYAVGNIAHSPPAAARTKAGSEELVTLHCLYNTVGYAPAAVDRNAIATAGYAMEYPSPQDLSAFMTEYRTDGEDATFTVTQVNGGGNNANKPGFEANLGLHVIFSSSDWGVGREDCLVWSSNGQVSVQFLPEFPASCPAPEEAALAY
ncbi:hypothetical protein EDB86DRAFT_3248594 [Lactarius hatsudake]|nr:hypothetical protein EDB86DRAFT_3248594 [Lactarius hatsudake]